MIITKNEIVTPWVGKATFPRNIIISDKTYFSPDIFLLKNNIYPKFNWWLNSLKWSRWSHKWDCDNFADAFKLFASGYYLSSIDSNAEGIAVGVINYMANSRAEDGSKGGHAINVVYINDNNMSRQIFFEPQNGSILNLTEEEFNSIWTIYM